MKFSINPFSLVKTFWERKKEKNLRIARYLDCIFQEASELAHIWQDLAEKLINNDTPYIPGQIRHDLLSPSTEYFLAARGLFSPNSMNYWSLDKHYRTISSIMGKNHKDERDSIILHIGSLLQQRKITKDLILDYLKSIKEVKFYHPDNQVPDLYDLAQTVDILHKEASAIKVCAQSFRAKI